MVKYGPGMGYWVGTGIAPPPTHPSPIPRVHPPSPGAPVLPYTGPAGESKLVVGLRSVDQLSLSIHFSGSRGMTEVYNLSKIGRINNHSLIPGTK